MKRRRKFPKNDVANQTIEQILLYLDDQITLKEFDRFNSSMMKRLKPTMTLRFDQRRLLSA